MQRKLPAYPLFVKDPNFSIWSMTDIATDENTKSWYGEQKPIYGFVKTDEGTYCFLGDHDSLKNGKLKRAEQLSVSVTSFTTDYRFRIGRGTLFVSFVSPLLPSDVDMISMPVCYMNFKVAGVENAEVSLFVNRRICYNDIPSTVNKTVRGGVVKANGYEAAFVGLKRQMYLSNNHDGIGADHGYFYIAGKEAFVSDERGMCAYIYGGAKDFSHCGDETYIAAIGGVSGRIAVAYDDIVAIDYFGSFKKTAYLEKHTIFDGIAYVMKSGDEIDKRLGAFDARLKSDASRFGGDYYDILVASLRQTIAAHKLARDDDGEILFLSKECNSNGCIGTVDISYPSMPLFLLYNVELIKGMMRPIFKFAEMPIWKYDFAPHDVGTYPACCGQAYGLKCDGGKYHATYMKPEGALETHYPLYLLPPEFDAYDLDRQMPVEECANMLIMLAACFLRDGDIEFFKRYKHICDKWVRYLVDYGLKPDNQLCTDDFAGHLKNNINLAIKATVGIGAYSVLLDACGDKNVGAQYIATARKYAGEIAALSKNSGTLPLTWDSGDDTFSLKYNLAFDRILGLCLFPRELCEREVDLYIAKADKFGTPLDTRASYTKSDWLCWSASLTDDAEKAAKIISPIARFLRESPFRVPFADWFDTKADGAEYFFRARSVQGGCFILLLNGERSK